MSVHSLWQSNWQKITIIPGGGRKRWSCRQKVGPIFYREGDLNKDLILFTSRVLTVLLFV